MRTTRMRLACMLIVAGASLAHAQQPGDAPKPPQARPPYGERMGTEGTGEMRGMERGHHMGPMGGPDGGLAGMLLAHTGELKLTDQQVTKLAAISRRITDRHHAMHATMDSLMRGGHSQAAPADKVGPHAMPEQMRAMMQRAHDDERGDVREALSVLSIDQQADAWMLHAGGHGGRHPMGPPDHMPRS